MPTAAQACAYSELMLRIHVPTRPGEAAPAHLETNGPVTTLRTTFGEWLDSVPCIVTLVQVMSHDHRDASLCDTLPNNPSTCMCRNAVHHVVTLHSRNKQIRTQGALAKNEATELRGY
jgi:hypothetical protein